MEKQESKGNLNKGITLFVVVAMSFMATLDSSIVNVVLPVMSEKMDVPLSSIEWVVAIYSIIICSTLLFFGRVGDILGKTKIFQYGSILFTLASLMCGLCHSFVPLVICRLIQGIGASAYMATNQGIIAEMYPKEKRGKALGILMAAVALGTMVGPPAGGFILWVLSWNYILPPVTHKVYTPAFAVWDPSKNTHPNVAFERVIDALSYVTLIFYNLIVGQIFKVVSLI